MTRLNRAHTPAAGGADPGPHAFEEHRADLLRVAYRLLSSHADAEDAVQEAWLRWNVADRSRIVDPRGWLVTVTGRICLDVLRSARVRRESYVGPWLPEPVVQRLPGGVVPAGRRAVVGADRVARLLLGLIANVQEQAAGLQTETALINGDLGLILRFGRLHGSLARGVLMLAIAGGRITGVFTQLNPAKLRLPSP